MYVSTQRVAQASGVGGSYHGRLGLIPWGVSCLGNTQLELHWFLPIRAVEMASTHVSTGAASNTLEWERFDSPELAKIVVDGNIPSETNTEHTKLEDSSTDSKHEVGDVLSPQEHELDHRRITSMFQASSPNTGSSVEVGRRPATTESSKSSHWVPRPASAIPKVLKEFSEGPDNAILTAIFSIDKTSYDVCMFDDKITWTPVSTADVKKPSSRSDFKALPLALRGMVYIHEICSVRLKNIRNVKSNTVTTVGFAIFNAMQRGDKLREQTTTFLCFSRDICIEWASRIKAIVTAQKERPRRILTLTPHTMATRQVWDDIIESRFESVVILGKLLEIQKSKSVSEYVEEVLAEQSVSQGPNSYDGILVLGKASFFAEALNTLHKFKKEVLKSDTWHPTFPTIGFLPMSNTSFVGKELHGCADVETALFHAIYGCTQSVHLCTFHDKDGNFIKRGLTASYGFSGGDTMAETNKGFGSIQGSIRKGLAITKAIVQRRSYPCEILYKDSPQNYEPFDDDEIFAEHEFSKFSIVNQHYVDDDIEDDPNSSSPILRSKHSPSDADSGVWPQSDKWDTVARQNYLDITVTSLPQHGVSDEVDSGCQLSAILVRETMSRRDLLMGKGSQVSLSSLSNKKPVILDKTDIIRGTEFIIKPCQDARSSSSNAQGNYLSSWTIDDVCIDANIQELHVKIDECPVLMYSRAPGQPLSVPLQQNVINLESGAGTNPDSSVA